jgi:hypothetical protein
MSGTTMTGQCLCGAVRYRATGPTVFSGVCHCTNCQRATGSAFSVVAAVPTDSLTIEGAVSTYVGKGDSGNPVTRRFCPVCGSPLTSEAAVMAGITMIEVGTLDHPGDVAPGAHIYCDSKITWVPLPDGVPTFPKMPPMGG